VGMGANLAAQVPAARAVFDQADRQLGFSLSTLCFSGPEEALTDTVNQQPALFTVSLAAWEALKLANWQPYGPPDYVAGHSLGELSALTAAGSLTFQDGLNLVRRRGELMKAAGVQQPGAMAAVLGLDIELVVDLCAAAEAAVGKPVRVANDNCPGQTVISGDQEALAEALRRLQAAGARKLVTLPITIAAHSPLMAAAAADFAAAVDQTPITAPQIPVIGNVSARPLTGPEDIRAELKAQLTSQVRWTESIRYLLEVGAGRFVEVGPGDVLTGLVKRIDRQAERYVFGKE
jgi:[acyl-carrier-protein] S-malonyltransferase